MIVFINERTVTKDTYASVVDEIRTDDPLFKKISYAQMEFLKDDSEYKTPNVKTWVYSNMIENEAWFTESGFTFYASNNKYVFDNLNIYKKGVMVIKTLDFKLCGNRNKYGVIIDSVFDDSDVDKTIKAEVLNNLRSFSEGNIPINKNEVIRIVYFIPEDDLVTNKLVKVSNVVVSRAASDLSIKANGGTRAGSVATELPGNVHTISLSFNSLSGEDMCINLLGAKIKLDSGVEKTDPLFMDHDSVNMYSTGSYGRSWLGCYKRRELGALGCLSDSEENDKNKTATSDIQLKTMEVFNKKMDTDLALTKFFHEHNVSLHKLFSYVSREEAALLSLEKEEVATAKELMKLLGGIK